VVPLFQSLHDVDQLTRLVYDLGRLIRFLRLHGLEQALFPVSPTGPPLPSQVGSAVQSPTSYLPFVGPVIWAFSLQQVALRPTGGGAPQPLARSYVAFVRAHWAPLAALAVAVVMARFPLPAYLSSAAFQNPAHFSPTGTDVQAQFRDCLQAYGVDPPPGASDRPGGYKTTAVDVNRPRPVSTPTLTFRSVPGWTD
jgi:hypothetical protein